MRLLEREKNVYRCGKGDRVPCVSMSNSERNQSNIIGELKVIWGLHWQCAKDTFGNMFYCDDDYVLL